MTMSNSHPEKALVVYYQINYTLTDAPADCAYFHAQFRRVNPLPYKEVYTIVDGIRGQGHFVGTSMGWGVNNNGWRDGYRYLPGTHDICSTAFWYQTLPAAPFPTLPDRDALEIV